MSAEIEAFVEQFGHLPAQLVLNHIQSLYDAFLGGFSDLLGVRCDPHSTVIALAGWMVAYRAGAATELDYYGGQCV